MTDRLPAWLTPRDSVELAALFAELDTSTFHPHAMDADGAALIAGLEGADVYRVLEVDGRLVAYGLLRGWDEGFSVPSLGVAVRIPDQGKGYGRETMLRLHDEARERGAERVRLRVAHGNARARRLYESLGYVAQGDERGELLMLLEL